MSLLMLVFCLPCIKQLLVILFSYHNLVSCIILEGCYQKYKIQFLWTYTYISNFLHSSEEAKTLFDIIKSSAKSKSRSLYM